MGFKKGVMKAFLNACLSLAQLSDVLGADPGAVGSFIHTVRSRLARRSRSKATGCQDFVRMADLHPHPASSEAL
jgi:hypothetical protein